MEKPIKREIYSLPINRTMRDLLLEITNLDNDFGCIASNKFLAESLKLKPDTISRYISKLKESGYVIEEKFNGRTRTLRSIFSGKYSNAKSEIYPMQTQKKKTGEEGSIAKSSNADLEKNQTVSTLQSTSNNVRTNFKQINFEIVKKWEDFQKWALLNLTYSTNEELKSLEIKQSNETILIIGKANWTLQEMIKRYLLVKNNIKQRIEFIDRENAMKFFEKIEVSISKEFNALKGTQKVVNLTDYLATNSVSNDLSKAL